MRVISLSFFLFLMLSASLLEAASLPDQLSSFLHQPTHYSRTFQAQDPEEVKAILSRDYFLKQPFDAKLKTLQHWVSVLTEERGVKKVDIALYSDEAIVVDPRFIKAITEGRSADPEKDVIHLYTLLERLRSDTDKNYYIEGNIYGAFTPEQYQDYYEALDLKKLPRKYLMFLNDKEKRGRKDLLKYYKSYSGQMRLIKAVEILNVDVGNRTERYRENYVQARLLLNEVVSQFQQMFRRDSVGQVFKKLVILYPDLEYEDLKGIYLNDKLDYDSVVYTNSLLKGLVNVEVNKEYLFSLLESQLSQMKYFYLKIGRNKYKASLAKKVKSEKLSNPSLAQIYRVYQFPEYQEELRESLLSQMTQTVIFNRLEEAKSLIEEEYDRFVFDDSEQANEVFGQLLSYIANAIGDRIQRSRLQDWDKELGRYYYHLKKDKPLSLSLSNILRSIRLIENKIAPTISLDVEGFVREKLTNKKVHQKNRDPHLTSFRSA